MISLKQDFSRRELLWFGPLFALFGGMVGALARWKFGSPDTATGVWLGSLLLITLYYLVPPWRKGIFAGWLMTVFPLGWILSHLLLTLLFYGVVFPIGLLMRLFRYDPLDRRFDRDAHSYWKRVEDDDDPRQYFRQF